MEDQRVDPRAGAPARRPDSRLPLPAEGRLVLIAEEVATFYESGRGRMLLNRGMSFEYERMLQLLGDYLPPPPADVLDVGGGPGYYARALARSGYRVHLLDPVARHVHEAATAAARQPDHPFTAALGDARELAELDGSHDAVLLFGPMYHLTERRDRLLALREARRVLRPDGVVLCHTLSRFFSLVLGLSRGHLRDPSFLPIVKQDLADGQHRNPSVDTRPEWFTTAFFHRPEEVVDELEEAGFTTDAIVSVNGPSWLAADWFEDVRYRALLLWATTTTQFEPSLRGISDLLTVARVGVST